MKPSDILNDTSGILHRKAADAANKRRVDRKNAQKKEQDAKWKAEKKAAEETAHRKAQEDAKREAEKKLAEEERIKEEEEAMWASMSGSTKRKKESTGKTQRQGKIRVTLDGREVDNLSAAMAIIDPVQFGKRNDFRDSEWTKINRTLKRYGTIVYRNHTLNLI